MRACVCVCACACMRAYVCMCVCVCVWKARVKTHITQDSPEPTGGFLGKCKRCIFLFRLVITLIALRRGPAGTRLKQQARSMLSPLQTALTPTTDPGAIPRTRGPLITFKQSFQRPLIAFCPGLKTAKLGPLSSLFYLSSDNLFSSADKHRQPSPKKELITLSHGPPGLGKLLAAVQLDRI